MKMSKSQAGKMGYTKNQVFLQDRSRRLSEECRSRYSANPKGCRKCLCPLSYEKRRNDYCSRRCSTSANNLGLKGSCEVCSGIISRSRRYCDSCLPSKELQNLIDAKTDGTRKKILIRSKGATCNVCSLETWMGAPIPLELDHVDGNSDHNDEGNLRLLCLNCHGQTPTYRARNVGMNSSRNIRRRARYRKGVITSR